MGIIITIVILGLFALFVLGRGPARTVADVVVTTEKAVKATPAVTAKAANGAAKATVVAAHVTGNVTQRGVTATKTGVRVTKFAGATGLSLVKSGARTFGDNLKTEMAARRNIDESPVIDVEVTEVIESPRARRVAASKKTA